MNEQERRQEILQAEEVIRQLAREMARVSESATQAEEARRKLDEASAAMNQAKRALDEATKVVEASGNQSQAAVTAASKEAVKALAEASEQLDRLDNHIMTAIDRLQAAAQAVEGSPEKLSEMLDSRLAELASLLRWALTFAALAVVGIGASIVLRFIRTG